jgi:hypothetical protein
MATVYCSADRSRFFIVPDDVKLRAGEMRVQSLAGEQSRVDLQQLLPYEVPEEEARRHVEERLAQIEVLRKELLAFAEAVRAFGNEIEKEAPPESVAIVTKLTEETLDPLLKRSPT